MYFIKSLKACTHAYVDIELSMLFLFCHITSIHTFHIYTCMVCDVFLSKHLKGKNLNKSKIISSSTIYIHHFKFALFLQYEQEILALRTAMEDMHHKLVTAEEQAQVRPGSSEGSEAMPPTSPCDPRQRSSSTASPLTHHQHSRHNRQSPQCPLAQQTGDQGAQMREMIQK